MSTVGYYRYKFIPTDNTDVNLYINYSLASTKKVYVKENCPEGKRLKFINRNGHYRYVYFNKFYEEQDKVKELGKSSNLITSLLSSKTDKLSLGYSANKNITLNIDDVSQDELDMLQDIFKSPRVYYYIGDGTSDEINDWILVSVTSKKTTTHIKKGGYINLSIDIELPEWYTINSL